WTFKPFCELILGKISSRVFWEKENWNINLYFCQKTLPCMYVRVFSFFRSFYIQSSEFL
uniref:Uncharacterized protein n=3 Tax=Canis lupus TaxID=9612 RepID=A0A8C0SRT1_CANLF